MLVILSKPYPRALSSDHSPRRRKKHDRKDRGDRGPSSELLFASSFCCYFARWGLHIAVFLFLLPFCLWTIELTLILFFRLFCSPKQHPKKAAHNRPRVCVWEDATKLIFPLCRVRSRGRTNLAGASSSVKLWLWRLNWCRCVSFPIDFWCFPHGLSAHHRGTLHHYLGSVNMGASPSGWS